MGKIITFYSYKGGTGRSMMLANIAWLLACNGERVLVIDWDLEAPGLHRYFKPFLVDPDMVESKGLVDMFWAWMSRALVEDSKGDMSQTLNSQSLEQSIIELEKEFEDYTNPLTWTFGGKGSLDFIGAGRQGDIYSERVNTFDWKRFYQLGGGKKLNLAKKALGNRYDFVLIDSRTGVSDTSGICTMQMPDVLVACLTLNRQSIDGVASILESIRTWQQSADSHTRRDDRQPEIVFYPVVTRIENSEKDKLDLARARARQLFESFLPSGDRRDVRKYWDDMEVTYRPFYAYEEILAAFGDTAGAAGSAKTLLSEMEAIGSRVSGRPGLVSTEIVESDRQEILAQYAFGAPSKMDDGSRQTDGEEAGAQPDTDFLRDIYAKEERWRTSGFKFRHLLSRRELQLITQEERAKFGRQMTFFQANSELFPIFRDITGRISSWIWVGTPSIITGLFIIQRVIEDSIFRARYSVPLVGANPGPVPSTASPFGELPFGGVIFDLAQLILTFLPVALFAFFASVVLRIFVAQRSANKPYGIRLFDIVYLSIIGPFVSEIKDFQRAKIK
jgi:cellulose biosynthesis protein BcsQ